jgi:hypothetical protein
MRLFFHQNRLEPPLEEMTDPVMPTVIRLGVAPIERARPPHGHCATDHMIDHLRKLQTQGGRDMAARLVVEHDLLFKTLPYYSFSSFLYF